MEAFAQSWAPRMLSVLRIMSALLVLQHGTAKILKFPPGAAPPQLRQVDYRDQSSTVIANDGSLFPGDIVALKGAHQMQMALKNKSGGGVDPHAGHTH